MRPSSFAQEGNAAKSIAAENLNELPRTMAVLSCLACAKPTLSRAKRTILFVRRARSRYYMWDVSITAIALAAPAMMPSASQTSFVFVNPLGTAAIGAVCRINAASTICGSRGP